MSKDYYDADALKMFENSFDELRQKKDILSESFILHEYKTESGMEFGHHGFGRRLNLIWFCLESIFSVIPPSLSDIPTDDECSVATVHLHAFLINIVGACDNLAWVLVHEKEIKNPNGNQLNRREIGLRRQNELVRGALGVKSISVLDGLEDWFSHIQNFRDPLAHRIPLYVPPVTVSPENLDEYDDLDRKAVSAILDGDYEAKNSYKNKQNGLKRFRPFFTQSFHDETPTMVIHPQLISDFGALMMLGEMILGEM